MTKIYDRVKAFAPASPYQHRLAIWLSAAMLLATHAVHALWLQNAYTTPQTCSSQGTLNFTIMDGTAPYQIHFYGLGVDYWTTTWNATNTATGFNSGNYANAAITDADGSTRLLSNSAASHQHN